MAAIDDGESWWRGAVMGRRRGAFCGGLRVLLVVALAACTAKPYVNESLGRWSPEHAQQLGQRIAGDRSPELLVMLAFSGGGARAAAMAYGVMQELADTTVATAAGERRLLDEVDIISSVSGGSFVSAYYGLFGDRLFEEFEARFLSRNFEGELVRGLLTPPNWRHLGSPYYGRSNMAAALYDETIFDHATFADLRRPDAPLVIINSTDIGTGVRFGFTVSQFDLICTDLDRMPVSVAVAASSAVPGIATPVAIRNHAGSCGYQLPVWLMRRSDDGGTSIRNVEADTMLQYLDVNERPWLHLVDGGIADNLGLRPLYTLFSLGADPAHPFQSFRHGAVRHILIIAVNASRHYERPWSRKQQVPGATKVLTAVSSIQMGRYNSDTIRVVRDSYANWVDSTSVPGREVSFEFVEVGLRAVPDEAERAYLNGISTSLSLGAEEVGRLVAAARSVLRSDQGYRRFVAANDGVIAPEAAAGAGEGSEAQRR